MMSGPEPDWIAEVTRAWMSLALTISKRDLDAERLLAFGRDLVLSSWSDAGTKSDQRK